MNLTDLIDTVKDNKSPSAKLPAFNPGARSKRVQELKKKLAQLERDTKNG